MRIFRQLVIDLKVFFQQPHAAYNLLVSGPVFRQYHDGKLQSTTSYMHAYQCASFSAHFYYYLLLLLYLLSVPLSSSIFMLLFYHLRGLTRKSHKNTNYVIDVYTTIILHTSTPIKGCNAASIIFRLNCTLVHNRCGKYSNGARFKETF